jgi:hypothetical protein
MSSYITQQAAQARVAEQISAAEHRALVREVRRARRTAAVKAVTAPRAPRFHLGIGHAVGA